MPLQIDPTSGEPYIQLPEPYASIRITPPRIADAEAQATMMNTPAVAYNFANMPYPYSEKDALEFIDILRAVAGGVLAKFKDHIASGPGSACAVSSFVAAEAPVQFLREVLPDGTDVFVGNVVLWRSRYKEVEDLTIRAKLASVNVGKPVGDPSIEWTICTCLAPSHQGRGIMTVAVRELIRQWAHPHLGARYITACAFEDNIGSQRVFLKNGFVVSGKTAAYDQDDLEKRGRTDASLVLLEWRAQDVPLPLP